MRVGTLSRECNGFCSKLLVKKKVVQHRTWNTSTKVPHTPLLRYFCYTPWRSFLQATVAFAVLITKTDNNKQSSKLTLWTFPHQSHSSFSQQICSNLPSCLQFRWFGMSWITERKAANKCRKNWKDISFFLKEQLFMIISQQSVWKTDRCVKTVQGKLWKFEHTEIQGCLKIAGLNLFGKGTKQKHRCCELPN